MSRFNKIAIAIVVMFALTLTFGVLSSKVSLAQDDNKALVTKLIEAYNAAFKAGDAAGIVELLTSDYLVENTGQTGTDSFATSFKATAAAFPDGKFEIVDLVAEGDKVVARLVFTGTNTGPLAGMPATGKAVKSSTIIILTLKDGKFAKEYSVTENFEMLLQLGFQLMPPAAATPAK
jgi:steroid delta-isomerase-like uncharacterized protein